MNRIDKQRKVVRTILAWYTRRGRTLPWRHPVLPAARIPRGGRRSGRHSPYHILLSEVMLQQTQVSRVLVKYPAFLKRFPTLQALASAPQREVVLAWQGMGYNNRAVRLHRCAQEVTKRHGGTIPGDYAALRALPGIGRYTANALLCSAFGKRVPIVDVNVQRVLSRIFRRMRSHAEMCTADAIWNLAETLLPGKRTYDWNQALMDLGATVCTSRSPQCSVCPVTVLCSSRTAMRKTPLVKRRVSSGEIPDRIYRGKIIEHLRSSSGTRGVRMEVLAKAIHPSYAQRHERWLRTLVAGLEKDGLVRVWSTGPFVSHRVSLA